MRIATAYAQQSALDSITERQTRLVQSQEQLSSGKRVNRPSDDPSAAAEAERLRSRESRMDADRRAIGHAREMLSNADAAIGDATGVLQSARDALLSAGNATLSAKDRANVAVQLRHMREQLVSVANRGDGQGGFVFGGQGTAVAPFASDGSAYAAPAGTMKVGQAYASEVSFDGSQHFTAVASPGGPENIFARLDAVIATLEDPATSAAAAHSAAGDAIGSVDRTLDRLATTRTVVGERLKGVDMHEQALETGSIQLKSRLSDLVDVDIAAAITQFTQNQSASEVALKAYAQVSRLTLFNEL